MLPKSVDPVGSSPGREGAAAGAGLVVTCWGTRGSVPSPGEHTTRFGGNTSCVEVRTPTSRVIFDAGTGIRALGRRLAEQGEPLDLDLFLTHFHWDHIQGIPFFAPIYESGNVIRVHGPTQDGADARQLIAGLMEPAYFPIPFHALGGQLTFGDVGPGARACAGTVVTALRVQHAGVTYGYRAQAGGASVAYIPDNELAARGASDGRASYDELVAFLDGVDLLIHDAMFTDEEYPNHVGWGHSTFREAVQLAQDAGARRLLLFHHAPERSDAELLAILDQLRGASERAGSALEIAVATEGEELEVVAR